MGLLDDAIREHLELKRQHGASDEEIERAAQEALTPARRDPSAGAGVPAVEDVPPPPPPPPAAESEADMPPPPPPPPVDEPVYADEHLAEPAPADPDAPEPSRPLLYDDEVDDDLPPEPSGAPEAAAEPEPLDDQATQIRPTLETSEPVEAPPAEPEPEEAPPPGTPKPHGDPATDEDDLDAGADDVAVGEPLGDDRYRARTSILDDPLGDDPLADEPLGEDPLSPTDPPPPPPPAGDEDDVLEETPEFLQETPEHDKLWFEQKPPRDFDFD